jgi:hypothetical protein
LLLQIEMLMEQCSEPEFSAEVLVEGGEDGEESLKVCLAVGRALNDRLNAAMQETAAPARAATDPSDLVPLPMPDEELSPLPVAEGESAVENSDEELPVGEVDGAMAAVIAARTDRVETFNASC